MATNTNPTNFPQLNVPFVNKDGFINEAWFMLLVQMFLRTGGASGVPANQITLADVFGAQETFAVPSAVAVQQLFDMVFAKPNGVPEFGNETTFAPTPDTDSAQAASRPTLGASPAVYHATSRQGCHITGGTVSVLSVQRGAIVLPLTATATNMVELSAGDLLNITYTSVPTLTILPR